MQNLVSLTHPNLQILEKAQTIIPISGFLVKSPINKYYHNSRFSNGIEKKYDPVTRPEKHNVKKIDGEVVLAKYDIVIIFPIYGLFGAIRNPDFGHMVYNSYIFINTNSPSYKN